MSLIFNPESVGGGFTGTDNVQANFATLQTLLADALSRSGASPNTMSSNFDMNSNLILNLPQGTSVGHAVEFSQFAGSTLDNEFTGYTVQDITATAGQTAFTLITAYTPGISALRVYVNGVYQSPASYTETSATVVTFSEGLDVGDVASFVHSAFTAASSLASSAVTYAPGGTGAVASNVQAKLRESVSILDFGAVADGTTDNAAVFTLAIAKGGSIYVPAGNFAIDSTVTLVGNSVLILAADATITWGGAPGGTMFDTTSTTIVKQSGIISEIGGKIDMTDAGFFLDAHTIEDCEFGNLVISGTRITSTVFRISGDSTGGGNCNHNHIHDIKHNSAGGFGTLIHLRHNNSDASTGIFHTSLGNLHALNGNAASIRLTGTENTVFYGMVQLNVNIDGARGVLCEQDTVATKETLHTYFDNLVIRGGTPGTDQIGLKLEDATENFRINNFNPTAVSLTSVFDIASTVVSYFLGYNENQGSPLYHTQVATGSGELSRWERSGGEAQIALFDSEATPASGIGRIKFQGNDDAGNETNYAAIIASVDDDTNTSEDGSLTFNTIIAGTETGTMLLKAGSVVCGVAQLADAATDGFLYVPTTTAGAPTGTPTTNSGMAPVVIDDTNDKIYIYSSGAWVTPADAGVGETTVTFGSGDATPSVLSSGTFKTAGTTTITDFDDGVVGQTIYILATASITIAKTAAINLQKQGAGLLNFNMIAGDSIKFKMYNTGVWEEVSRSHINSAYGIDSVEISSGTRVITAAETGRTFFINNATGFSHTLPAADFGLRYKFIVRTAPTSGNHTVIIGGGDRIHGQIGTAEVSGSNVATVAIATSINFIANLAIIGDYCEVICDNTNWFVSGLCNVQDGMTTT